MTLRAETQKGDGKVRFCRPRSSLLPFYSMPRIPRAGPGYALQHSRVRQPSSLRLPAKARRTNSPPLFVIRASTQPTGWPPDMLNPVDGRLIRWMPLYSENPNSCE